MRTNALIPLQGVYADPVGAFARGQGARAQSNEYAHLNALRGAYKQHGGAAMQGNQNALAAIAQYDPAQAMNMRTAQHGMQATDERTDIMRQNLALQRAAGAREAQRLAAQMDADQRAAAAAELQAASAPLLVAFKNGPEAWDAANDSDPRFENVPFERAPYELAKVFGAIEALMPAKADDLPTSVQEYEIAKTQGFDGTLADWKRLTQAQTNVVNNLGDTGPKIGTIPSGMAAVPDPNNPAGVRFEAIPGGPAAIEAAERASVADTQSDRRDTSTEIIERAADEIRQIMAAPSLLPKTGTLGNAAASISESSAAEIRRRVDTLTANAKIENLQEMRNSSPTGGALGAVSDKESAMLAAKSGAIDPGAGKETFLKQVDEYEWTLLRIVHGVEGATRLKYPEAPPIGEVQDGYEFRGGNPRDPRNWSKAQ